METYDLVSHGTSTEGQNECYGNWDGTNKVGYGPGYVNSCIHTSNTTENNIVDTVWYNYTLASAGTIKSKNDTDTAGNSNIAAESICPKGWALPTTKQINTNKDVTNFSPVFGGRYLNSELQDEDTHGYWWGSETEWSSSRWTLIYSNTLVPLGTGHYVFYYGHYIRCVSEEKTVTDLTYMQDMTPSRERFFVFIFRVLKSVV